MQQSIPSHLPLQQACPVPVNTAARLAKHFQPVHRICVRFWCETYQFLVMQDGGSRSKVICHCCFSRGHCAVSRPRNLSPRKHIAGRICCLCDCKQDRVSRLGPFTSERKPATKTCTVGYVDCNEPTSWDMSSHLARATVFEELVPFLRRIGHPGQEVGLVCPPLDITQYVESSQRCCRRHIGTYGRQVFANLLPLLASRHQ
jgi:hypothetical protein